MTAVPQPRHGDVRLPIESFIDDAALGEVLALAWSTFVDPDAVLVPVGPAAGGEPGLVAEVQVRGETPASISISIDVPGARAVTERMLVDTGLGAALDDDDMADAMGELANILGGNLKALLPEGSTLTLPSVVEGPTGSGGQATGELAAVATVLWGDHLVTATVSSSTVSSSTAVSAPAPKGTHP